MTWHNRLRKHVDDDQPQKQPKYKNKRVVYHPDHGIIGQAEAKKRGIKGITFDSKAEVEFYLVLLQAQKEGIIKEILLQPAYILQPAVKEKGLQAISYRADFHVTYADGRVEVIDIKGLPTETSLLKFKMFQYHYPDLKLVLLKKVGKTFVELRDYQKKKREEKKAKRRAADA